MSRPQRERFVRTRFGWFSKLVQPGLPKATISAIFHGKRGWRNGEWSNKRYARVSARIDKMIIESGFLGGRAPATQGGAAEPGAAPSAEDDPASLSCPSPPGLLASESLRRPPAQVRDFIREKRRALGLSESDLAEAARAMGSALSATTVHNAENGMRVSNESAAAIDTTLRLNPAFACWLMGWPWWWTNPEPISFARSAMASYLSRQRRLLEYWLDEQPCIPASDF
jgi:transcriptional regulator with XRE-family HTH domain